MVITVLPYFVIGKGNYVFSEYVVYGDEVDVDSLAVSVFISGLIDEWLFTILMQQ